MWFARPPARAGARREGPMEVVHHVAHPRLLQLGKKTGDDGAKSEADEVREFLEKNVDKSSDIAPSLQLARKGKAGCEVVYKVHAAATLMKNVAGAQMWRREDVVRFVCVSDLHGQYGALRNVKLPDGDVLVNCGDLTMNGSPAQLRACREWTEAQPHKHKIVIAGNHDVSLDPAFLARSKTSFSRQINAAEILEEARSILREGKFVYLEDTSTVVEGLRVFGSPVTPEFFDWAFMMKPHGEIHKHWAEKIPADTDILLTHGPPAGYGDKVHNGTRAGCMNLLYEVKTRVRPLAHVFGHIHEACGAWDDGETLMVNAAGCSLRYRVENPVIVFDVPRPCGGAGPGERDESSG